MTTIQKIKENMKRRQITEEIMNYNGLNRDTQRFAIKCSSITRPDGTEQDVFKNPITDPSKASKKGRITTFKNSVTGEYSVRRMTESCDNMEDALVTVFENGAMVREFTMDEIRKNTRS